MESSGQPVQGPVDDVSAVVFATRAAGPSVQRLVLGGHLRRLRERAGFTTEQAAEAIRASHSKISRMEHGRVSFKERDIADLLTLYGVTSLAERQGLLALAREANTPGWWAGYSDILPNWLEPYFGLEAAASFIRTYELQFVPGLLQTEEYAGPSSGWETPSARTRSPAAPRRGSTAGCCLTGKNRRVNGQSSTRRHSAGPSAAGPSCVSRSGT